MRFTDFQVVCTDWEGIKAGSVDNLFSLANIQGNNYEYIVTKAGC